MIPFPGSQGRRRSSTTVSGPLARHNVVIEMNGRAMMHSPRRGPRRRERIPAVSRRAPRFSRAGSFARFETAPEREHHGRTHGQPARVKPRIFVELSFVEWTLDGCFPMRSTSTYVRTRSQLRFDGSRWGPKASEVARL